MSAQLVDVVPDAAAPYVLTKLAEVALAVADGRPVTLTTTEAARALMSTSKYVGALARQGALDAVKVDEYWLIDGASVLAYDAAHPRPRDVEDPDEGNLLRRWLPAAPLLRQFDLAQYEGRLVHRLGLGEQRAIERARQEGALTINAADHLAVKLLGLTLWDLYEL
jgi:hypothetical protein